MAKNRHDLTRQGKPATRHRCSPSLFLSLSQISGLSVSPTYRPATQPTLFSSCDPLGLRLHTPPLFLHSSLHVLFLSFFYLRVRNQRKICCLLLGSQGMLSCLVRDLLFVSISVSMFSCNILFYLPAEISLILTAELCVRVRACIPCNIECRLM